MRGSVGCLTETRRLGSSPQAATTTSSTTTSLGGLIDRNLSSMRDLRCAAGYMLRDAMLDRRTLIQTGLAMTSTRGRTAPRSYTLQVLGQQDESQRPVALGARAIVVGAHGSCDLVLDDPKVSRRHAEISIVPDGIRIKDLGSTNGTWWQGTKVGEVVVPAGSTVKFGETQVKISAADAPSLPPSDRDHFGAMACKSHPMRELFAVLAMA